MWAQVAGAGGTRASARGHASFRSVGARKRATSTTNGAIAPRGTFHLHRHAPRPCSRKRGAGPLGATFRRGRAVLVAAPPVESATPPAFYHDVRGPSGALVIGDIAADSSALLFQPFETKERLYEFLVASELTETRVPPGTLLVRGGYARTWAAYDTVRVDH